MSRHLPLLLSLHLSKSEAQTNIGHTAALSDGIGAGVEVGIGVGVGACVGVPRMYALSPYTLLESPPLPLTLNSSLLYRPPHHLLYPLLYTLLHSIHLPGEGDSGCVFVGGYGCGRMPAQSAGFKINFQQNVILAHHSPSYIYPYPYPTPHAPLELRK